MAGQCIPRKKGRVGWRRGVLPEKKQHCMSGHCVPREKDARLDDSAGWRGNVALKKKAGSDGGVVYSKRGMPERISRHRFYDEEGNLDGEAMGASRKRIGWMAGATCFSRKTLGWM